MKITGLITEYNPFHNGHQYHLKQALRLTGADAAVVVMSGNYVQRGEPAIMPKHLRAEAALKAGAAAVLELPVFYASGSAELFALGAVSLLHKLGCVDSVCFGTESGDLKALTRIASLLTEEPEDYRQILREHMKSGISFPAAREKALAAYTKSPDLAALLSCPNNILGTEYLKALSRLDSKITPYALRRKESEYHDETLRETYSSASAVRSVLAETDTEEIFRQLEGQIPSSCTGLLTENYGRRYPVCADDFSLLLKYRLLTRTAEELSEYADVSRELANRIIRHRNCFVSFSQFCDLLKTKQLTRTRISRGLLHILLGIRKEDVTAVLSSGFHGYARLLGFRKEQAGLLTAIKKKSQLPLFSKIPGLEQMEAPFCTMLKQELFASDLYESVITGKFHTPFRNEYEHPVVRI